MLILLSIIIFFMIVLFFGKSVKEISYPGYFVIGIITTVEVLIIFFLLFTMEAPTT